MLPGSGIFSAEGPPSSIVCAGAFHFRVRDGNGWSDAALTTKEHLNIPSAAAPAKSPCTSVHQAFLFPERVLNHSRTRKGRSDEPAGSPGSGAGPEEAPGDGTPWDRLLRWRPGQYRAGCEASTPSASGEEATGRRWRKAWGSPGSRRRGLPQCTGVSRHGPAGVYSAPLAASGPCLRHRMPR